MTGSDVGTAGSGLLLQIRGLRKEFDGKPVLDGVSMDVRQGEVAFVIGPSGSGKSTLLRCINRLEQPSAGSVRFDGKEITHRGTRLNQVRQQIGFVFQAFNLYPHMTALGNVALALRVVQRLGRVQASDRAMAALRDVGLAEKAAAYPAELSGGQQQRVAIARALVLRPRIMLFDEPTSALDPELIAEVQQVMLRFRAQGMTMVIVSHEMRFAREIADRVIFMDQGRIVEEADPASFFANPREPRTRAFLGRLHG